MTTWKKPQTFEKSFASHQNVGYWHPTKNGEITPQDIYKNTTAEFWWHCDACSHDYLRSPNRMKTPCPYCAKSHFTLCCIPECRVCYEKSFASHYRAAEWHPTLNVRDGKILHPYEISKKNDNKFWFKCNDCGHDFDCTLHNLVTHDSWCPYCCVPTAKLCKDGNCQQCFNNSLASIPKAVNHWHPKNKKKPRDIHKGSGHEVWLRCSKCPHDFAIQPQSILRGTWCPYCTRVRNMKKRKADETERSPSPSKLCGERSCTYCFPFSFASHPKALQWHPTKNGNLKPHQVHRGSGMKAWFKCHKCQHDFDIKLCKVVFDQWCPYCCVPTAKLCKDGNCQQCFNNSLASSSHAMQMWIEEENHLNPRYIIKGSKQKCMFKCTMCMNPFPAQVIKVYNGSSCPICKNKTESAVFLKLKEYFGDAVKHLGQKKYRNSDSKWQHCPGYFDIVIELGRGVTIFIEVDGRQHFQYVEFFRRTVEENQEIDLKKHFFALERGCYVIRIDQQWVAKQIMLNVDEWAYRLKETILKLESNVEVDVDDMFLSDVANKYSEHPCYALVKEKRISRGAERS